MEQVFDSKAYVNKGLTTGLCFDTAYNGDSWGRMVWFDKAAHSCFNLSHKQCLQIEERDLVRIPDYLADYQHVSTQLFSEGIIVGFRNSDGYSVLLRLLRFVFIDGSYIWRMAKRIEEPNNGSPKERTSNLGQLPVQSCAMIKHTDVSVDVWDDTLASINIE